MVRARPLLVLLAALPTPSPPLVARGLPSRSHPLIPWPPSLTTGWKTEVIQPKPNRALHAKPLKYADNFKWQGPKGRDFPELYVPPAPKQ